MIKVIVGIVGIIFIIGIVWWFFGKHQVAESTAVIEGQKQRIKINVDGGYSPEKVVLKQNVPAELIFTRKDASSCLDHVVFPDLGINQALPKDQPVTVKIDTKEAGDYNWACGMNMFHGQLKIEPEA
ncbi:cupredoxin domain-containing protein [Weissella kandleri]|nr:cupredoxin domain-containing protein [Weissella kandleri]